MANYEVGFHRKAKKFIDGLPGEMCKRITAKVDELSDNPRPFGYLKLTDFKPDGYRIRVGKYRILYRIYDHQHRVLIFHVDLRDDAYSK